MYCSWVAIRWKSHRSYCTPSRIHSTYLYCSFTLYSLYSSFTLYSLYSSFTLYSLSINCLSLPVLTIVPSTTRSPIQCDVIIHSNIILWYIYGQRKMEKHGCSWSIELDLSALTIERKYWHRRWDTLLDLRLYDPCIPQQTAHQPLLTEFVVFCWLISPKEVINKIRVTTCIVTWIQ